MLADSQSSYSGIPWDSNGKKSPGHPGVALRVGIQKRVRKGQGKLREVGLRVFGAGWREQIQIIFSDLYL